MFNKYLPAGNISVQVYEPETGPTAVCNTVSDDLALRDYEDIDNPRPNRILLPSGLRNNDYNQTSHPHGVTYGYEIPLRVRKFCLA